MDNLPEPISQGDPVSAAKAEHLRRAVVESVTGKSDGQSRGPGGTTVEPVGIGTAQRWPLPGRIQRLGAHSVRVKDIWWWRGGSGINLLAVALNDYIEITGIAAVSDTYYIQLAITDIGNNGHPKALTVTATTTQPIPKSNPNEMSLGRVTTDANGNVRDIFQDWTGGDIMGFVGQFYRPMRIIEVTATSYKISRGLLSGFGDCVQGYDGGNYTMTIDGSLSYDVIDDVFDSGTLSDNTKQFVYLQVDADTSPGNTLFTLFAAAAVPASVSRIYRIPLFAFPWGGASITIAGVRDWGQRACAMFRPGITTAFGETGGNTIGVVDGIIYSNA